VNPQATPPEYVQPAPRLADDLAALNSMFQGAVPAVRLLRPTKMEVAVYGIGDASGAGYGSAFADDNSIWSCYGVWGPDAEDASSNFRELCNLTEAIEYGVQTGRLKDCELFIFTDNTTAEAAYYKGNSDSRALFELVVRLRRLDMVGGLRLHVVHIAGTRMIASGVDGLSRGNLTEGLLLQPTPTSFCSFVPLTCRPFSGHQPSYTGSALGFRSEASLRYPPRTGSLRVTVSLAKDAASRAGVGNQNSPPIVGICGIHLLLLRAPPLKNSAPRDTNALT